jgi:mRNA interferase RelE/StbE
MRLLKFTVEAKAGLAKLDTPTARQILKKIGWLAENFELLAPEPLTGEWKGVYKLRVGDYRALYTYDQKQLVIHFIRHRREVYKSK